MKEFRVKRVDRWIVTEWEDYRGGNVRQLAEVPNVAMANEIAEAFGLADPEALVNLGHDAPDVSYGLPLAARADQNAQIKRMVERFLSWRLPENFDPDGGISFTPTFNEQTAHPMRHEPLGTNLLDYTQAEAMVRHILEGPPSADAARTDCPAPLTSEEEVLRALPYNIAAARRRAARAAGDERMLQMMDRCQVAMDA